MKHSFGLLLFNVDEWGVVRVFLAQANGPRYWKRGSVKCWGLPKGGADVGELPLDSAKREFGEEIGMLAPDVDYFLFMEHVRSKAARQITVFCGEVDNVSSVVFVGSNFKHMKGRGKHSRLGDAVAYPEVLAAGWFTFAEAKKILLPGQKRVLKKFKKKLKSGSF